MFMSQAHVLYLSLSAFYTRCSAHIQSTYSARSVHAWETLYLNNIEREGGRQGGASTLLNDIEKCLKHLLRKLKRNSLLSESDGSEFSLQFANLTCPCSACKRTSCHGFGASFNGTPSLLLRLLSSPLQPCQLYNNAGSVKF